MEVQDVLKTAATHGPALTVLQKFEADISSFQAQDGEDGEENEGAIKLSPGFAAHLPGIMEELPKLRAALRKGFLTPFLKPLRAHILDLGQAVLKAGEISMSSADLNALMHALKYFQGDAECTVAHTKLIEWATKHNTKIVLADFGKWMKSYMETAAAQTYVEVIPVDMAHVKPLVAKLPVPVPDGVGKQLLTLMPMLLRRAFLEDWSLVCLLVTLPGLDCRF